MRIRWYLVVVTGILSFACVGVQQTEIDDQVAEPSRTTRTPVKRPNTPLAACKVMGHRSNRLPCSWDEDEMEFLYTDKLCSKMIEQIRQRAGSDAKIIDYFVCQAKSLSCIDIEGKGQLPGIELGARAKCDELLQSE